LLLLGEITNPNLLGGNFLEEVAQGLYPFFHPSMERKKLRKEVNLRPLG
jgi:hypothetical protein